MQNTTPVTSSLPSSPELSIGSAQISGGYVEENEGYRRVRCCAAMIGLAISMSAISLLAPNQSKPALATGSLNPTTNLSNLSTSGQSEPSQTGQKTTQLTPPALKHQVKEGESIWTLAEEYRVDPHKIANSNRLPVQADLEVGQTVKIPSPETESKAKLNPTPAQVSPQGETSLDNLRATRKRLQESLVALREENSTLESKSKVIVTETPDASQSPQTTTENQPKVVSLSTDLQEGQSVQIPVESPSVESQDPVVNTLETGNNPVNRPIPVTIPQNSNLSRSREQEANSNTVSRFETSTSSDSSNNSVRPTPSPTAFNNFDNSELTAPKAIELPIESPTSSNSGSSVQIPQVSVTQPSSRQVYRVQPGDNLNSIARRHKIPLAQLLKANNITNPNLIKINQPLVIPKTANNRQNTKNSTVVANWPVNRDLNTSQLPPVPSVIAVNPTVSSPPILEDNQSYPQTQQIPTEQTTETYTDKLRADINGLQQDYNQGQSIPIAVESVEYNPNSSPLNSQTRNPEWDNDRSRNNTPVRNHQTQISQRSLPQEQIISTAPTGPQEYNDSLQIPVGETVSPELPGLSNPDEYLPDAPAKFNGYIWPAKGVLTSGYGRRWGRMHRGIDIAAPVGTPIFAAAPGEVISAGWNSGGYGNLVKVRHADGSVTYYAHNSRLLVRTGQQVEQGQQIAQMGSTGFSTGPHLHFEVHPGGQGAVNPIAFLPKKR